MIGKMSLFGNLIAASSIELAAPVDGEAVPLKEVQDPTFGEEILGKGMAVRPEQGSVYAPCDATVELAFETGHAVSLKADSGAEILIHIGIDTVRLNGKYFRVHVSNGDHVSKGQLLIEFDREAIAAEGYDTITPMVICNSDDYRKIEAITGNRVHAGDKVLRLFR